MTVRMPISGTTDAPTFDGSSADLLRYFQEFDFHANAAGLCGQPRIEAALRYISCDDAETWETLPESTEDDYRAFVTAVKTLYLIDDDIHKEVATFTTDFADIPAPTHDSPDLAFLDPDNVITDEILHFPTLADIAHLLGPNASLYLSGINLTCSLSDSEVSEPISDNADTTDSLSIDSAPLRTNIDERVVTEEVVVTTSANDLVGLQSTATHDFGYDITDEIPTDRDIADLAEFTAVPPEFESSEFSELDSIVCIAPEVPLTPPGLPPRGVCRPYTDFEAPNPSSLLQPRPTKSAQPLSHSPCFRVPAAFIAVPDEPSMPPGLPPSKHHQPYTHFGALDSCFPSPSRPTYFAQPRSRYLHFHISTHQTHPNVFHSMSRSHIHIPDTIHSHPTFISYTLRHHHYHARRRRLGSQCKKRRERRIWQKRRRRRHHPDDPTPHSS